MKPTPQDIVALHRGTGAPVSDCRDALIVAKSDVALARQILERWIQGQPWEMEVPSSWGIVDVNQIYQSEHGRKCPKCEQQFEAIPDVATCPHCGYCFRSSSRENPRYFEGFVRHAPEVVSGWFIGNQLLRVRSIFARMATYGTEGERHLLNEMARYFGEEDFTDINRLLTTVSAPKLRAIGELFVAISTGYDAIDHWIDTWGAQQGNAEPGKGHRFR